MDAWLPSRTSARSCVTSPSDMIRPPRQNARASELKLTVTSRKEFLALRLKQRHAAETDSGAAALGPSLFRKNNGGKADDKFSPRITQSEVKWKSQPKPRRGRLKL